MHRSWTPQGPEEKYLTVDVAVVAVGGGAAVAVVAVLVVVVGGGVAVAIIATDVDKMISQQPTTARNVSAAQPTLPFHCKYQRRSSETFHEWAKTRSCKKPSSEAYL